MCTTKPKLIECTIVIPSGVRPTFVFKTWGFGLTRFCKTTKVKHTLFGLVVSEICLNPCLFFLGCGLCNLLLWNLWSLEQICYQQLPTNRQNRTKGVPGEAKIGPRWYPPEVSKASLERNRKKHDPPRTHGSNMGTQILKFGVFSMISFAVFPHHLFDVF